MSRGEQKWRFQMRLDGKVALVTGASRGIGRAIAVRLGRDGAAVVVNYSGNHKAASETVATIEAASGRAVAVQGDVGKLGDIQRLFDAAFEHFGKLDILVNNAGIMFNKPVADVTEEEYDRIFAVNVKGTLNETLRWTRSTLAPFALVRLYSLVPHLLPVVLIIPVVTICARAFPVACLSRRSDHAILLACHGNLYHDSAPTALH